MCSPLIPSLSSVSIYVSGVDTCVEENLVPVRQHFQPVPPPFPFSATTLCISAGPAPLQFSEHAWPFYASCPYSGFFPPTTFLPVSSTFSRESLQRHPAGRISSVFSATMIFCSDLTCSFGLPWWLGQ